jgi:nicotinamidase-related amidase
MCWPWPTWPYFKLPTILTTSFETGPNGPLVPELKAKFPTAPYIARGQINAWDNEDFVKAVKATGKQLIVAGVVTEVCVAFPCCRPWLKASRCS